MRYSHSPCIRSCLIEVAHSHISDHLMLKSYGDEHAYVNRLRETEDMNERHSFQMIKNSFSRAQLFQMNERACLEIQLSWAFKMWSLFAPMSLSYDIFILSLHRLNIHQNAASSSKWWKKKFLELQGFTPSETAQLLRTD